jgi:hypothetical protein
MALCATSGEDPTHSTNEAITNLFGSPNIKQKRIRGEKPKKKKGRNVTVEN